MKKVCIVVDTREQMPLPFEEWADEVRVERRELWPGDYSVKGRGNLMAVERKSVSDLIGTMCGGYAGFGATTPKRFDRELIGLGGIVRLGGAAFVLVEPDVGLGGVGSLEQIKRHAYRSAIQPSQVLAFVRSVRDVWRVPVVFAESRRHAAEIVVATAREVEAKFRAARSFDAGLGGIVREDAP